MRVFILLVLALMLAGLLALFPDVADQPLRIEAFGWLFETRQGPFILLLIVLLAVVWLAQRILSALAAGPGQVWQALRSGSRKRREARLREGLAALVDMRGDLGARTFRKTRGVIPRWGNPLLSALATPAREQPLPEADDDALLIALRARIATDPDAQPKPDLAARKAHLEAWLKAHPGAPLALERKIELAEEEGDWATAARLLEDVWKRGGRAGASIRPRLARACMELAREHPEQALEYMRKAHRLMPEDDDITLALGRLHIERGEARAARKLWMAHLETHDDEQVAMELHALLKPEAMKAYRKMKHLDEASMPTARAWLRAQLAHDAGLSGLAMDHMKALLKSRHCALAWRTLGDWHMEQQEWAEAASCYRQALQPDCRDDAPDVNDAGDIDKKDAADYTKDERLS